MISVVKVPARSPAKVASLGAARPTIFERTLDEGFFRSETSCIGLVELGLHLRFFIHNQILPHGSLTREDAPNRIIKVV